MIRGDAMVGIECIGQLKAAIRRLADLPRKVAEEARGPLNEELQAQFVNGEDPYGTPWEPVKPVTLLRRRVKKTPPPLTDTGELRSGTRVELNRGARAGLLLHAGAPYAYFHQVGFSVGSTAVPPRRILPQFGLPARWKIILRRSAAIAARRAIRG